MVLTRLEDATISKSTFTALAITLSIAFVSTGCSKSKSDASGGSAEAGNGAGQFTGVEGEARDAAFAEIARHCVKGTDGWTTARTEGSPYAPEHYLRQFREIPVDTITASDLSDADRLNGVEWKGSVTFKTLPCREAGDPGQALGGTAGYNRQHGQWTSWFDCPPEAFSMTKTKGKWDVFPNSVLIRGQLPTPNDYANAGVK